MKKEAGIEELYEDYKKRNAQYEAEKAKLQGILAEDKKRIDSLNAKLSNVSNISEEEYIATSKALENERLTMEMHDKQLKHLMNTCKGFMNEAERQNFISILRREYINGEKEFKAECEKHMEALNELMQAYQARTGLITEIVTKTDTMKEVSFAPSNERSFVSTMLVRYNTMKRASNVSAGFSSK